MQSAQLNPNDLSGSQSMSPLESCGAALTRLSMSFAPRARWGATIRVLSRLVKRKRTDLLKDITETGLAAALLVWATATPAAEQSIPQFMSASNALQHGFVRIINHSDESGVVVIEALDDAGRAFRPVELTIEPFQKLQFNSDDLELGNESKGIPTGIGGGQGDWRLHFESDLPIEALAYIRTTDGFLTSMHDVVVDEGSRYRVPIFYPGSNRNPQSQLRLINPHDTEVSGTFAGVRAVGGTTRAILKPNNLAQDYSLSRGKWAGASRSIVMSATFRHRSPVFQDLVIGERC